MLCRGRNGLHRLDFSETVGSITTVTVRVAHRARMSAIKGDDARPPRSRYPNPVPKSKAPAYAATFQSLRS